MTSLKSEPVKPWPIPYTRNIPAMNVGFRLFVNIVSHSIGSVRIDNNGFLFFVFVIVVVESCCVDMVGFDLLIMCLCLCYCIIMLWKWILEMEGLV